ncbi:MAG TPA: glycosyltransferase family 2 protein [Nitrospiraceae bacterium]|jgi:glycosyltransferase involved in cell wall biosynthesis|nr:glycosyltransferase family 2 protein [Nitrospiraceae bacterium]
MAGPGTRSLSVIIPALNEEENLRGAVSTVLGAIGNRFADYELLIFDDASSDETGRIADELAAANFRIRVIHNPRNFGLGYNFSRGVELARMEYVAWFPGDNEVPGEALPPILDAVGSAEIVVPYVSNAWVRPRSRRAVSTSFVAAMNRLFGLRLRYYNGLCVFPRSLLLSVPLQSHGFAYMAAILIRLIRSGHSYVEVPMLTNVRQHGRTKAFRLKNIASVCGTVAGLFWEVHVRDRQKYAEGVRRVELRA